MLGLLTQGPQFEVFVPGRKAIVSAVGCGATIKVTVELVLLVHNFIANTTGHWGGECNGKRPSVWKTF